MAQQAHGKLSLKWGSTPPSPRACRSNLGTVNIKWTPSLKRGQFGSAATVQTPFTTLRLLPAIAFP